jgi:hypothetical protein
MALESCLNSQFTLVIVANSPQPEMTVVMEFSMSFLLDTDVSAHSTPYKPDLVNYERPASNLFVFQIIKFNEKSKSANLPRRWRNRSANLSPNA